MIASGMEDILDKLHKSLLRTTLYLHISCAYGMVRLLSYTDIGICECLEWRIV